MSHAVETPASDAQFPATAAQSRLWTLDRDHGDRLSRNIAVQWELQGTFSDSSVEAAFQAVIDRHEVLRTRFREVGGALVQEVAPQLRFHLGVIDLRGLAEAARDDRIRQIAVDQAGAPFALDAPEQIRATLVRTAPDRAQVLIATHYGVFDGYSIKVLGREIGTLIAAFETGARPDLPELQLQFGDYARWRAACADSGAWDDARTFWHGKLEGFDYFELPSKRLRPQGPRAGATLKLPLPNGFRADLEKAAKDRGTSSFALGAAVMAAALHAVSGRADVGFTTCVAGRDEVELEDLIGTFVNPVVLRFDCGGASVGDLMGAARRIVAEALAHGDYPIDALADDLNQPVSATRTPFVAPFFSLQQVFVEEQTYGPLRIVSVPSHTPQVSHDIAVQVIGRDAGWHLIIDYDTGLYDEAAVRRFAAVIEDGFAAAFARPDTVAAALASPSGIRAPAPANVPQAPAAPHLPAPRAAPRTLAAVSALWQQTAGAAPDGPQTDFFDLGGNSLAALRMLSRVEADIGARIAIADFFDDPTLGGLARKIDDALGTEPEPSAEDAIWSEIILRRAPVAAPLIVSLNQPFLWHGLARALPTEAEVINLHIRDLTVLEGEDPAVLAALIDGAAQRIAARAAGRPLLLMGHCVDGTLAYLVAQALDRDGHRPELLAMVDCWAPDAHADLSPGKMRRRRHHARARRWAETLRQRLSGQIGWTAFLSRFKVTRPILERLGRVQPATDTERMEWAVNARLVGLVRGTQTAPYPGETVLFSTAGQAPDARPRLFGWSDVLPADTGLYDLAGWHEYALKQDGVATISAVLSARLSRRRTTP